MKRSGVVNRNNCPLAVSYFFVSNRYSSTVNKKFIETDMSGKIKSIGRLETRWTQNLKGGEHYPEIVKWENGYVREGEEHPLYCYSLAYWEKDEEGWNLTFFGDRPFDISLEHDDMWELMKHTQGILDYYVQIDEDNGLGHNYWDHYGHWKIEQKAKSLGKTMVDETVRLGDELYIRKIVRDEMWAIKRNEDKPF
mgnify:FL=1|jgi:hypothetical protein